MATSLNSIVEARRLHLDVSDVELARRRVRMDGDLAFTDNAGGYQQMQYIQHVMPLQASEGADLDFLVGCRGTTVARESHSKS